jgi:hypothetical protein
MADPNCYIQPFGICIAQANAVSGALVAAFAALITTVLKLAFDIRESRRRQAFEQSEREAREKFEREQSERQRGFEAAEAVAATNRASQLQQNIQDYVQLGKWREASWVEKKALLEKALEEFDSTYVRLGAVIKFGPTYDDLKMIQETASALDVFGDFQSSMSHRLIPNQIKVLADDLISQTTRILLTLSPVQKVRGDADRRATLEALYTELASRKAEFEALCAEFEHNPPKFDPPRDAA